MKSIFNFLTFTILFAGFISAITAQETQKLPSDAIAYVEDGISTKYEPVQNKTSVYAYLQVYESERNIASSETLTMSVGFSHTGKAVASKPNSMELGFISTVKTRWRFSEEKERKFIIVIDNEQFDVGALSRIKTRTFSVINQQNLRYVENLAIFIPFETFQKMAEAKKVAVKIGSYKFKLRKDHLKILRGLLSRTN